MHSRAAPISVVTDVQVLQTAAGIENLAVRAYHDALARPFVGGTEANPVAKDFMTRTAARHAAQARAFNAAVVRRRGRPQSGMDPKFTPVVRAATARAKALGDVVGLAITLEDVIAQTCVKDTSLVSTRELRELLTSVAGVAAQHRAVLLVMQALLQDGLGDQIAVPPDIASLPPGTGAVGFPDASYPSDVALAPVEGAVR